MRLAWSSPTLFFLWLMMTVSTGSAKKKGGYCMGDPHCLTFDEHKYDCQYGGEFVFLSVPDTETLVQATFEIPANRPYSRVIGVTAQEKSSPTIEVTESNHAARIMVDGAPWGVDMGTLTGVDLQITDGKVVKMLFDSGVEVVADVRGPSNIALWAHVLPTMDTRGLLGNNNGDDSDEETAVYCGRQQSLPFVPRSLPNNVVQVCGDNVECIYDAITVDLEAAVDFMSLLHAFEAYECPPIACPPGVDICDDPHMRGLQGQKIEVSGVDGGWYCLVTDTEISLHVNVRFTAPLSDEFPDRQLITGLALLSEGHSLVVEVKDPYSVHTTGCTGGISPCLADGGLRILVDGEEVNTLLTSTRNEFVADGIEISASNLPTECRQFGGDEIWAGMYEEMLQGRRELNNDSFEDWVLGFESMAAPDWCARYIAERGLADVQSSYALLKIYTPYVNVRVHIGINHQGGDGEVDWDGRVLPDLKFWQMNAGVEGLDLEHDALSGILGETARLVYKNGRPVMTGDDAFRGTVEDYRVSGAVGTDFPFLRKANA